MQIIPLLLTLLGVVAFVGYVWLLVVAFKESATWGVLVLLFSPITAIVFAIKNWDAAKKPFLTYMGSGAASVAVLIVTFVFIAAPMFDAAAQIQNGEMNDGDAMNAIQGTMDRMDKSGTLDDKNQAELDKMRQMLTNLEDTEATGEPVDVKFDDDGKPTTSSIMEQASMKQLIAEETAAAQAARSRDTIALREIDDHVGKLLRVVNRDGTEFVGRYVGDSDSRMEFHRNLRAGVVAVYYTRDEVESLHKVPVH